MAKIREWFMRRFRHGMPPDVRFGQRYRTSILRAQRLLPDDPKLLKLKEEYEKAEEAILGAYKK